MSASYRKLFPHATFYRALGVLAALFVLGHFWHLFFVLALVAASGFLALVVVDLLMLFPPSPESARLEVQRVLPVRFSNGDNNQVTIKLNSRYAFPLRVEVIDELPLQFQVRDFSHKAQLTARGSYTFSYYLKPGERGEYHFGHVNIFVWGRLAIFSRRFRAGGGAMVKVYPSFVQMRQFEIMAISDRLNEIGIKKIRRHGHQMEFEQIREYIQGDDVRALNWKATARRGELMVNQYQDEKSQQVFSIVDMGRTMQMPFEGLALLDYAINTSLVLSNVAILRHDRAGLITFNEKIRSVLPARREPRHLQKIMEVLYNQRTGFLEHNLEALFATIRQKIPQRSLLVLFTNFVSLESARRELPLLRHLASGHLLLVVFFENAGLHELARTPTRELEDIYLHAIAEKFIFDKKQIVKELQRNGIHALLTTPGKLTVAAVNQYLEFKARGVL